MSDLRWIPIISGLAIFIRNDNLRKLTKSYARSYFKALQWENGLLHLDPKREQALLRGILLIQETLREPNIIIAIQDVEFSTSFILQKIQVGPSLGRS